MEHSFNREKHCADCGRHFIDQIIDPTECPTKVARRQLIAAAQAHEGADYGD